MKVLLLNCSPHADGTTHAALAELGRTLAENGVDSEIYHIGSGPIALCGACGGCGKTGRCVKQDGVNEVIEKMEHCDGLIVGSPVHYASVSGGASAFLDRLFFAGGRSFRLKPAAAVVCARRAGCTNAFDTLNKYFTFSQMPVVSSQYWNVVYGRSAEDIQKDEEGLQILRTLARNMAWLLRCIDAGKQAGVSLPETEPVIRTNFIR